MYIPSKSQSHGRIGEAAVLAKCWMHGIPAHNTGGLRANFVVFGNLVPRTAKSHTYDGSLDFQSLSFYIVPGAKANLIYQGAVKALAAKPKRDGGSRKLGNMAVNVPGDDMADYKDASGQLKSASKAAG